MDIAWIGAIGGAVGGTIGLLGAAFGTYCGLKNAKTPAERRFIIRFVIGDGLIIALLVGLPLVLSLTGIIQLWLLWVTVPLYIIVQVSTVIWANKRQATLRGEQA